MAAVYIDGEWFGKDDAKISVYDHGLLYGDGLFEGIRIYNGKIFKLEEHIDRLFQGAGVLLLEVPLSREETVDMLAEGVRRFTEQAGLKDGYIRLIVTRGKGDFGIDPEKCEKASVISIFDTIQLYPREYYDKGIAVITASTRRLESSVFDPRVKSLNYLNNIFAKQEAKLAGCMEAVLLNREGYVTECTADNIFIVTDGVLKTPAPHLGILEGITRRTVLDLAREVSRPAAPKTAAPAHPKSGPGDGTGEAATALGSPEGGGGGKAAGAVPKTGAVAGANEAGGTSGVKAPAAATGIPAEETVLTRFDLYTADECFITGSGAELMPVVSVDGRIIGGGRPGPVTKELTEAFRRLVG